MTDQQQSNRVVGQTQDAGFQIGVRRTLAADPAAIWQALISPAGLAAWLGSLETLTLEKGARYETHDGARGQIRVVSDEHIRLTWQPAGWDHTSSIQVRVIPNGENKTLVSFHQDHLAGPAEREAMRQRWEGVLDWLGQQSVTR